MIGISIQHLFALGLWSSYILTSRYPAISPLALYRLRHFVVSFDISTQRQTTYYQSHHRPPKRLSWISLPPKRKLFGSVPRGPKPCTTYLLTRGLRVTISLF